MGCISSKVLSRSLSIQEELNQTFQRRTNGVPDLEELFTSTNGTDHHQFLTLVCTANKAANEIRTGSFALLSKSGPKPPPAITPPEAATNWELLPGLGEQHGVGKQAVQPAVGTSDDNVSRRSKSFHRIDGIRENEYDWESKAKPRSRSFHTVEEFDAMLEKIQRRLSSRENEIGLEYYCESVTISRETDQSVLSNQDLSTNKTALTYGPDSENMIPSLDSDSLAEEMDGAENGDQEGNISEKGAKRKGVAKGLRSLEIPSTIELPTIGSLREWLQDGSQYFTPKFGNYNYKSQTCVSAKDCDEDSVFNPELVAAFEECMQQLEVEEESIIKQIEGGLEVDGSQKRGKDEEGIQSLIL